MAYLPPEEEDSKEPGMNVLGQEGQPAPQEQQQPQVGSSTGGAPMGGGAPVGGGQAPSQSRSKPKGSGLFTDIRKYIQAGQPSAGKIAGAVGGKVKQQTQDIRNQVENQKQKFQQGVAQNQANLQQSQQFAQEAVQKAGSGQLQEPDFKRFQDITSGATRFDDISALNLQQQQARTRSLQGLAGKGNRAPGREALLRETFGKGKRYTKGQRAIDSLLLGSNEAAQQQMQQGLQQDFQGLTQGIGQARKSALQDIAGLRTASGAFTGQQGAAAQSVIGDQGARTLLQQQLASAGTKKFQEMEARRGEIMNKLQNKAYLTKDEMEELGVSSGLRGSLQSMLTGNLGKDVDFGSYFGSLDPKKFSNAAMADPEQRAKYNALSQLVGQGGLQEGQTIPGFEFGAQGAIQDALSRQGFSGIDVGEQGLSGQSGDIANLKKLLSTNMSFGPAPDVIANMLVDAGVMGAGKLREGTLGVDEQLQNLGIEGINTTQALDAGISGGIRPLSEAVNFGEGIIDNPAEALGSFAINPYYLTGQGIVGSGGEVLKSARDLANAINPAVGGGDIERVLAALGTGGLTEATSVATSAVSEAKRTAQKAADHARRFASNLFCFTADTLIKIATGEFKKIQDIDLGEKLWLGGEVNAVAKAYANDSIYEYKGTHVTGSHAVFEEGEWGRVEDSPYAVPTDMSEETVVYPLNVDNHIMVVNDFIASDFQEVDDEWAMDQYEKIELLNSPINADKNRWLMEEELKLQGGQ